MLWKHVQPNSVPSFWCPLCIAWCRGGQAALWEGHHSECCSLCELLAGLSSSRALHLPLRSAAGCWVGRFCLCSGSRVGSCLLRRGGHGSLVHQSDACPEKSAGFWGGMGITLLMSGHWGARGTSAAFSAQEPRVCHTEQWGTWEQRGHTYLVLAQKALISPCASKGEQKAEKCSSGLHL